MAETWFEENDPEGVAFEYEVIGPKPAGAWIRGTICAAPILPVDQDHEEPKPMIRFTFFGAFFVAFALAGPAWGAGGCGVGCSTTSEGACVRADGSKVCRFGTSAQPRHDQVRPAAPISNGVGNPCRASCVELTASGPAIRNAPKPSVTGDSPAGGSAGICAE
jgi:hypothetical protein